MSGTGPRQGTFLGNVTVSNPTVGDVLQFNASAEWQNTPITSVGTTVITDGTSIGGDGSIGDPISAIPGGIAIETDNDTLQGTGLTANKVRLKRCYSDLDSLEGTGLSGAPLKIRKVYTSANLSGLGTSASPLDIVAGTTAVTTDNDTAEGTGLPAAPIKVKKVYVNGTDMNGTGVSGGTAIALATQAGVTTGSTYVMSPRVQYNTKGIATSTETLVPFQVFWHGTQSFTNGGTFPNWIDDTAGTLDTTNYLYYNGGMFNGVSAPHLYGSAVAAIFTVTVYVAWTPVATGYRAIQLIIQKSSGGAFVELYRSTVSGSTTSNGPHHSVCWEFPCAAQCNWGIKAQQDSGGTMTNVPVSVTITAKQGPIGT